MNWTICQLTDLHDTAAFDCGEHSLDLFLKKHALNNDRAGLGRTYVLTEPGQFQILGYFTISTGSVTFSSIPDHVKQRLPKYPIPTVHLGRLAVHRTCQGQGVGETLLVEALRKAALASATVGVYAIDVIALNERAKRFYEKYGFVQMLDEPLHLFLSIKVARSIVDIVGR